jgi:aminopeptidase N
LLEKDESDRTLDSAGPVRLGSRLQNSLTAGAWRSIIYGKGTWIVHMLRRRLGDDAFLKLLGEICRARRFQPLLAKDFQAAAAAYLPKGDPDPKLDHFFEHWVENTGIPTVTMTTSVRGKAPRVKLTVNVAHNGIDDKAIVAVPVHVQMARGKSQVHWIHAASEPVTFTFDLAASPARVTLDPDGSVLRR